MSDQFLLPRPHAKQAEFLSDPHRYKVLNWGRRSGKSVGVWEKVVFEGMLRQGTYYIIAPTYKQAKEIYWRDICKRYKGPFMTFNEQELSITFDILSGIVVPTIYGDITINQDPDLPPTRIVLKGADNPDSLRGTGIMGAVLDEYAFMPDGKYMFDTIIRPALADRNGWAVFISTPNGIYNHFHDLCELAQDNPERYFYSHATALDNEYFPAKEFEEARDEYEREGRIDQFNQEWLAQFVNPTQLIYGDFQKDTHVFGKGYEIEDMPSEGTYCMAVDFGMTDPTAAVFVMIDFKGNWWIYDEVYQTDLHLEPLVHVLRDKMGDQRFTRILGDGAARFELESLRAKRFRITAAKKGADSLHNGIKEIQSLLKVREGTGQPKLFVHSSCKNTIKEFMSYSWIRDDFGDITNVPEDKNNHSMDAVRYLALDKARSVKKEKRKRHYDEITGRALN
jgi:phage terminase large subunit